MQETGEMEYLQSVHIYFFQNANGGILKIYFLLFYFDNNAYSSVHGGGRFL